eukprot:scaffold4731_cov175-Ochromonas_danica.AAC.20
MSMEMSTELSVTDMIKRFREGKPTSREERSRQFPSSQAKLWWEKKNNDNQEEELVPRRGVPKRSADLRSFSSPPSDYLARTEEEDSSPRPRGASPSPNPSSSAFPANLLDRSFDVDALIEKELRLLERDLQHSEASTQRRLVSGSFLPSPSSSFS